MKKQVKSKLGKGKALILLIFVVIMPFSLHSQELSNKEIRAKVDEAQSYFDAKDYDNATRILTEIGKSNPERIDQVVNLMDKIIDIRNQYNEKYRELLNVLYVEKDPDKAIGLIEELEDIEPFPNEVISQDLRNARISVELVRNRNTLDEQMDIAKLLLDRKDYLGALSTYRSRVEDGEEKGTFGYGALEGLGEKTYTTADETVVSTLDKNAVQNARDEIYDAAVAFLNDERALAGQINQFASEIPILPSSSLLTRMTAILSQMKALSQTRNDIIEKSAVFSQSLNNLLAGAKEGDVPPPERFFLDFTLFLVFGRSDKDYFEGIVSATDFFWEDLFLSLTDSINDAMSLSYDSAISSYVSGDLDDAEESFENTVNYARASVSIYSLLYDRITLSSDLELDEYSADIVDKYYGGLVDARIYARVTDTYENMIALRRGFDSYDFTDDQSIDDLYELRLSVLADLPEIDVEEKLWSTISSSLNWLGPYEALPENSEDVYQLVNRELNDLREEMKGINLAILTRLTDREYDKLSESFDSLEARYNNNLLFLEGIPDEEVIAYTGDEELLSVFPQVALPDLEILYNETNDLELSARSLIDTFDLDQMETEDVEKIESFIGKVESKIPEIQDLIEQIDDLIVLAENNIFQADGYINRGRNFLANIDAIISNPRSGVESFTRADGILDQATNSFLLSYELREDLDLRKEVDNRTARILEDLFQRKQRIFIDSIQEKISEAIASYRSNEYVRSRNLLEQAQKMWDDIYPGEQNAQIEIWLSRVIIALQFERGRTITKNEPLFEEMMQLLNHAQNNYSLGESLIEQKSVDDGRLALEQAINNLNSVKLYMPKNETVSLLELKIELLLNPGNGEKIIDEKSQAAMREVRSGNKSKAEDGLAELIVLGQIALNPVQLNRIQRMIQEAKYITGQEERPPDPKDLAESERLTNQAFQIISNGITSQYELAKTALNEALRFNPDNGRAISLLYQIQADAGGSTMPRELLDKLRESEELYARQEYLPAYRIIIELKKDPRSAKNQRVLELEELLKEQLSL